MEKLLYNKTGGLHNLVMAYPASEEFSLSSLGYMWLYKIAEETEGVNADKISTDKVNINPSNINSIAFSLSFDFDFMGLFKILDKLNIPFDKSRRDDTFPIVFAGGPVITTNPEPYKQFFDFMIIGDGEIVFQNVLDVLKTETNKTEILKKLKNVEGIYFGNNKVKRNAVTLNDVIYTPIISDKSYFKDTFVIEVSRGCMNRCAFCTASYTNLPYRTYNYEKIIDVIDLGLKNTNKIALLGAQISAHPKFIEIMKYLESKIDSGRSVELGISSLRTDSITPKAVNILVKGGQRHITIAIEAASERLRKFINKNLSNEQIYEAVKISRENGLKGVKIYSMIGIPTETQEDIKEFINLAKKIKAANKGFSIEFSFSTFVPKPQTPFQWSKREDTKSIERKQNFLTKEFAKIGISAKFSSAKWDYWQTILSRGDEKISRLMIEVYKQGGKIGAYKSAVKDLNINVDKFVLGFDYEEYLPWDKIESYPSKKLLLNEYKRLQKYN